jgi:myo-inositol-1(or 4)-monophosphatase
MVLTSLGVGRLNEIGLQRSVSPFHPTHIGQYLFAKQQMDQGKVCSGATLSETRREDLRRIRRTLHSVLHLVGSTDMGRISVHKNHRGDIASGLDTFINSLIRRLLPRANEGWLSEESPDDLTRLDCGRVWVVDPIDGTREFLNGIAEWCVSIGLVEDTEAVAGGVLNPSTGEVYVGSVETGLESIRSGNTAIEPDLALLVSRREYGEGKWRSVEMSSVCSKIVPLSSIAYRLARVAAGYAAATCTFESRNEWDVAGGVALVRAAGGRVHTISGNPVRFNNRVARLDSIFASASHCPPALPRLLAKTRAVGFQRSGD